MIWIGLYDLSFLYDKHMKTMNYDLWQAYESMISMTLMKSIPWDVDLATRVIWGGDLT